MGLVGSIDNDMSGTDITIGADTALHRITEAIDAIASTAASHQRTFVVEVMGRHCGYLALMGAIATGASWVLIPENPPDVDDWETTMCERLSSGRKAGRRDSIVIVAEGARDHHGNPITADHVRRVLEERLHEDVRVTILGHVQRGGAPSAFDRYMSTLLGHAAVEELLASPPGSEPQLIGMKDNRITRQPLMRCVEETRKVAACVKSGDYAQAMALRGRGFVSSLRILRTIVRALPHAPVEGRRRFRFAIVHGGGPAPGMNTAVRAALRLTLDRGHHVLGVRNSFRGLVDGDFFEMGWMSVNGWASRGGAELGTNRKQPADRELYTIARQIEKNEIDGILMIGGWSGYEAVAKLHAERERFPAFNLPMICLPAFDHGVSGLQLADAQELWHRGRDPQAERLQHGVVWQEPQCARLANQHGGTVRLVAHGPRLRVFLRLHRRRHRPVAFRDLRRHQAHRGRGAGGRQVDALRRADGEQGHRVDSTAAFAGPGQAVLRLLRAGPHPCAAPRAQRVDREVQGPVRPGLGQAARGDVRAPAEDGRRAGQREAHAAAEGNPGVGFAEPPIRRSSTPT